MSDVFEPRVVSSDLKGVEATNNVNKPAVVRITDRTNNVIVILFRHLFMFNKRLRIKAVFMYRNSEGQVRNLMCDKKRC